MTGKNFSGISFLIILLFLALIGEITGHRWVIMFVVLCFGVWVFHLLGQREKTESALRATYTAFIEACKEPKKRNVVQLRRTDLLSNHVD